ncbi:hypothetical protein Hdeb2414_s0005g00174461 [Helianthus debilis subsp. tardiflorus]
MVNHHISHSSTFSLVKFLMVPLRDSLLMTIQRLSNSPLHNSLLNGEITIVPSCALHMTRFNQKI